MKTVLGPSPEGLVVLGHIFRVHGVHGAVIIQPYTSEPELILNRSQLLELLSPDGQSRRPVGSLKGKVAAQGVIVKFPKVTSRTAAQELVGWRVALNREHLPDLEDDEVYWNDLVGVEVYTPEGKHLGRVTGILETGASPLLAVEPPGNLGGEILLPFHENFIVEVDLKARRVVLDPPPGLLEL